MRIGGDVPATRTALVMASARRTFGELDDASRRWGALFARHGLHPGDHVALLMANSPELFDVAWAAQRSGLYYTPVNSHLTAAEAEYIVRDCGARALVVSAALAGLAVQVADGLDAAVLRVAADGAVPGFATAADLLPAVAEAGADGPEGMFMFYSSGTTGWPKGVLRPLSGQPFTGATSMRPLLADMFGFGPATVYLSTGPLYHAAPLGWSMGTQGLGGTTVAMERFDAEECLRLVEAHRVTHVQFVPTMLRRLMLLPEEVRARYDVSSLRFVVHAAAPCPVELKTRVIAWLGPIVWEYYAGSEGNGFLLVDSATWLEHRGTVGRAVRGAVHVCDDDGTELPTGETGTVWFEGTDRFTYHNDPAKTASAYDARGWSTLGDVGRLDDEGFLYLADRRVDLILSGGVNVYPQEVENVLAEHPAVGDVAVIGVPDEDMGQSVLAVVEPAAGVVPDDTLGGEIVDWSRDRLAHFKCPRRVAFVTALPRLPTGKLLRRSVRDQFAG